MYQFIFIVKILDSFFGKCFISEYNPFDIFHNHYYNDYCSGM
ncbi:Uncharacterized protein dnm_034290 [Desulfonema magnum]|uniref:Uncharacterized protein n=1 Tax=Desulfonema magnum TaxID=45655 RepID=A0A975BL50_9BACT|nr:Uncharacterized protein dnm_034290 [Desulfonema magnum]